MSGEAWGLQAPVIREMTERVARFLEAVADTEELLDRSESGDTARAETEPKLYDLWVSALDREYDGRECDATEYIEGLQKCELRAGHLGWHRFSYTWN